MTILSIAYPLLPVGPNSGGGAEQILFLIERELVKAGHRSVVIAATGSQVSGELIETPIYADEITDQVRESAQHAHRCSIEKTLNQYDINLIHFHGLDFYTYLPVRNTPKLATLHLPLAWYPSSVFELTDIQLNCVSETQARAAPRNKLPVVPNGIDTGQFVNQQGQRESLVWLGRICPEKGVHIALEVARELDLPIVIAGPVHPFHDHQIYFTEYVQPLLDGKRKYVGPVGLEQKKKLLAQAICLLIPSLARETSSLVAMEAISSGTPVVAFRSGALPEVVEHGQTGFIVDSQDEMVDAVRRVGEISSVHCRKRAQVRFAAGRMFTEYMKLYADLLTRHQVSPRASR